MRLPHLTQLLIAAASVQKMSSSPWTKSVPRTDRPETLPENKLASMQAQDRCSMHAQGSSRFLFMHKSACIALGSSAEDTREIDPERLQSLVIADVPLAPADRSVMPATEILPKPLPLMPAATLSTAQPTKPGLEHAYAYTCLQDAGAYAYADEMLKKIDTVLAKMKGYDHPREQLSGAELTRKTKQLALPMLLGSRVDIQNALAEKIRLNTDILELRERMADRYAALFGETPLEIGSSGHDSVRIQQVITATSPADGVELREKMALIHHVMESFPHEVQKNAGVAVYANADEVKAAHATMTEEDRQVRRDKVGQYIASLNLDFPVSIDHLADFNQWWMHSDTVRESYHRKDEERTPHGRSINERHFEKRDDLRDFLNRAPWTRKPVDRDRTVNLAMSDPEFSTHVRQGRFDQVALRYNEVKTEKLNGTCYFVLNKRRSWYRDNVEKANLMVMTEPSGTADIHFRLSDIFMMPLAMQVNAMKALIGHMHADDHHSLHEIFGATDGHEALNALIRYDGTLASMRSLDPQTFAIALELQSKFLPGEIETRNRIERDRRAVFGEDEDLQLDSASDRTAV